MKLKVLPEAELEAATAAIWYDDHRFGLGDEFLIELQQAFDRISSSPAEPPSLESYAGGHDIRRCLLKRFPYLVIFMERPDEVVVVAVSHARRRPFYWVDRLA